MADDQPCRDAGSRLNGPEMGVGKLRKLMAYAAKVYEIGALLGLVRDSREEPPISTGLVARILLMVGLLRIRSFNALEPKLGERWMQQALGERPVARKVASVDAVTYALHRMDEATVREALIRVLSKAERNKAFREGWYGALRFVAIDGWEAFSSYHRHCSACLTRTVRFRDKDVVQYYHSYVVALLLGDRLEVVLDMEPVRSADVRTECGEKNVKGHEGELTAAKRLIHRLRETYGNLLDVLVFDSLYANGPILTLAAENKFGVISVAKKESDEPLKEAFSIWGRQPAQRIVHDDAKNERLELWDAPGVQTLMSYDGPIRVVRARVCKEDDPADVTNWCFAVTGKATRLPADKVVLAGRARWHIENTAFYQFVNYWHFAHVFTHAEHAVPSLLWFFLLAFNLLQLFVYRQLGGYGRDRGKDPTRTLLRLVDEFRDDLARLQAPLAWDSS